MGLSEFNARVQEIRDMVNQHRIDLKSDKLEYEIAKRIAKHYDTLKEFDIIQILNEISDNLDSKLTNEENLAIVDNILGYYLKEDKYTKDYVESYVEALEHWNRQIAEELTQQYLETEAENSVDWNKVLKPQVKPKDTTLPIEVSVKPSENPQVNAKPKPKVKVIKYKPEIPEITEIKEKVNALETQITLLDSKVTQLANTGKPNTDNHELVKRVEKVEKDLNEIKEKLDQLEIAFNNILAGELREIKARVEELRSKEFRPSVKDNRPIQDMEAENEKQEDKLMRKIMDVNRKVTTKVITTTLNGLNMGLKAYIEGLNYLEKTKPKPSNKRVSKTVKM
jgi:DNA repair exonuclease SbcCD ATPase subunit